MDLKRNFNSKEIKRGFTLIELLTVIAILGILVLLAAPKFLNYTESAKIAHIKNDIKVHEDVIEGERTKARIENEEYLDTLELINTEDLIKLRDDGSLFDKRGLVSNSDSLDEKYFKIPNKIVNTKLKGTFYVSEEGKVYYHQKRLNGNKLPEDERTPSDVDLGMENDFEWIVDNWEGSEEYTQIGPDGNKGYFKYIGTNEEIIEIPHIIQGVKITTYYMMFDGTGADVKKVISTNSNVTNMNSMFAFSESTALDLTEFDTSNVIDMGWMFSMSAAEELNVSKFDTSKVANMEGMFEDNEVKELDLSSFDTSNVLLMGWMFSYTPVSKLDVSSFDTSNVTDMSAMFAGLPVTSLYLENFDTSKVTDMDGMFSDSIMTTLDLRNFDTSNVKDMYRMFAYSEAESLDLTAFDTSNVETMLGMFEYSKAKELNLNSFDTSNVTEMQWMFRESEAMKLDLSSFDMSNVIGMKEMFGNSKATEGIARTQDDANKFNNKSITLIPDSLVFKVN